MDPDLEEIPTETTQNAHEVSGRFLGDFFRALERQGIPVTELLGDLPIPLGENGQIGGPVEWAHFCEFMRRLGREVDGPAGLEQCGEMITQLAPSKALAGLAGLGASPKSLYRASAGWALRRAIPGVETRLTFVDETHLEIHARVSTGLRGCPELFHFATGGARALPRVLGLRDAVVRAAVDDYAAMYQIAMPPSPTLLARATRFFRTVFSAGSVLRFLETQQLELHAKNEALQRANAALAETERRYRALVDTAVDVLCEVDSKGRIVYVSASIEDLIGYSPDQVTGSHYRLWIPREWHERVDEAFDCLVSLPEGHATHERIRLHARGREKLFAELTARGYDASVNPSASDPLESDRKGRDRRIICIIRDITEVRGDANTEVSGVSALDHETRIHETPEDVSSLVEHAIIGTPISNADDAIAGEWIETQKLLTSLRDGFMARSGNSPRRLELDLSRAPEQIWADEALLATSLRACAEWAAHRASAESGGSVYLAVSSAEQSENGGVQFLVRVATSNVEDDVAARAALELASQTARSIGAEVTPAVLTEAPDATSDRGVERRLLLPAGPDSE